MFHPSAYALPDHKRSVKNNYHFPGDFIIFIGWVIGAVHIVIALYLASVVKKDRERLESSLGTDAILTLGPLWWFFIVLFTGALGLALYWFQTYHPIIVKRYLSTEKKEN